MQMKGPFLFSSTNLEIYYAKGNIREMLISVGANSTTQRMV